MTVYGQLKMLMDKSMLQDMELLELTLELMEELL
jgi:hypothetical protein